VFLKNPVYNVLSLIVNFFCIAGHYFLLNAQFLAAIHIIVYAGAIMVLFLYVLMMLNLNNETEPHKKLFVKLAAVVSGGLFLLTLVCVFREAEISVLSSTGRFGSAERTSFSDPTIGLVEKLGEVLFGDFLLPFEVSSILFLAAMVGAVMIGKREIK
jgi:NADH-quinone oxidoreductase subunit J